MIIYSYLIALLFSYCLFDLFPLFGILHFLLLQYCLLDYKNPIKYIFNKWINILILNKNENSKHIFLLTFNILSLCFFFCEKNVFPIFLIAFLASFIMSKLKAIRVLFIPCFMYLSFLDYINLFLNYNRFLLLLYSVRTILILIIFGKFSICFPIQLISGLYFPSQPETYEFIYYKLFKTSLYHKIEILQKISKRNIRNNKVWLKILYLIVCGFCTFDNIYANQKFCVYFLITMTIQMVYIPAIFVTSFMTNYEITETSSKLIFILKKEMQIKELHQTLDLPVVLTDLVGEYVHYPEIKRNN